MTVEQHRSATILGIDKSWACRPIPISFRKNIMTKLGWLAVGVAMLIGSQTAVAQTHTDTGTDSDRIRVAGGSDSPDLYGSGNDDAFGSYGTVTFNMTAADFGVASVTDIDTVDLNLTFNDRGFSDGASFELFFTADDFNATYTGLTYDDSGANDPNGIDTSQFNSFTSLGTYALGFDPTDGANGGLNFDYSINFAAVEAELAGEINAGSDFTIVLAAVDNADDITFSGVGNAFDPGDPALTVTLVPAVPEPTSAALIGLVAFAGICRRRRS